MRNVILLSILYLFPNHSWAQSYFFQLNQSSIFQNPSIAGSSGHKRITVLYNKVFDDYPAATSGLNSLAITYDKLNAKNTIGLCLYGNGEYLTQLHEVDNFRIASIPADLKKRMLQLGAVIAPKFSLPNISKSKPDYSFSPSIFLEFHKQYFSDIQDYRINLNTNILQYQNFKYSSSLLFPGSGIMISSRNAFIAAKFTTPIGYTTLKETQTLFGFGRIEENQKIEKKVYLAFQQCYSAGITFPKKSETFASITGITSIGFYHLISNNSMDYRSNSFQNDYPVLPNNKLDYMSLNVLMRTGKLLWGSSLVSYRSYSGISALVGIHYTKYRIIAGFTRVGFSLSYQQKF